MVSEQQSLLQESFRQTENCKIYRDFDFQTELTDNEKIICSEKKTQEYLNSSNRLHDLLDQKNIEIKNLCDIIQIYEKKQKEYEQNLEKMQKELDEKNKSFKLKVEKQAETQIFLNTSGYEIDLDYDDINNLEDLIKNYITLIKSYKTILEKFNLVENDNSKLKIKCSDFNKSLQEVENLKRAYQRLLEIYNSLKSNYYINYNDLHNKYMMLIFESQFKNKKDNEENSINSLMENEDL
jgi:hypothetical protein